MTTAQINACFEHLLRKDIGGMRQRRKIGFKSAHACYMRFKIKQTNAVRLDTKIYWLRKAGYDVGDTAVYSHYELLAFAKYTHRNQNKMALELGMEYLLDKWLLDRPEPEPAE